MDHWAALVLLTTGLLVRKSSKPLLFKRPWERFWTLAFKSILTNPTSSHVRIRVVGHGACERIHKEKKVKFYFTFPSEGKGQVQRYAPAPRGCQGFGLPWGHAVVVGQGVSLGLHPASMRSLGAGSSLAVAVW